MLNILYVAKTPFQLMVVINMATNYDLNSKKDLILCDSMSGVDILLKTCQSINIFNKVYIYDVNKYISGNNGFKKLFKCYLYKLPIKSFWNDICQIDGVYDEIYISGMHIKYEYILEKVKKNSRNKVKINLFEDGFQTYTSEEGKIYSKFKFSDPSYIKIKKMIYMMFSNSYNNVSSISLYSPELLEWKPKFELKKIKQFNNDDDYFSNNINTIFSAKDIEKEYEKDVIFFEEAYYADGNDIGDVDIIKKIDSVIGKDRIMVKIHPRNPENRFEKIGYKTNFNTSIPWEVVAQNIDLSDKILITVASQSVLTILLNMSVRPKKIIMLMNCKELNKYELTPGLPVVKKIAGKYSQHVFLPTELIQVTNYLKNN